MSARNGNPKMQRAHFQLIADVIQGLDVLPSKRNEIMYQFALRLSRCNDYFNRERFYDACKTDAEKSVESDERQERGG